MSGLLTQNVASGLHVDVHVVLRLRAAEVDAGEAGVQPRGETVAHMADARLCLHVGKGIRIT